MAAFHSFRSGSTRLGQPELSSSPPLSVIYVHGPRNAAEPNAIKCDRWIVISVVSLVSVVSGFAFGMQGFS